VEEESRGRETVEWSLCAGGSAALAMAMARERRDMVVARVRGGRETARNLGAGRRSARERNAGRRRS
jgi:hypothetical protein